MVQVQTTWGPNHMGCIDQGNVAKNIVSFEANGVVVFKAFALMW